MFGVLRHRFHPPTPEQKAADLDYLSRGGELLVSARLISNEPRSGMHWVPQGYLYLTTSVVAWRGRHHACLQLNKDEWNVRSPLLENRQGPWTPVCFVNTADDTLHYKMRIPTADVDVVEAAFVGATA